MITINNQHFELTDSDAHLTNSQRETLEFLSSVDRPITLREAVDHFNLKSPAPLLCRLEHLIERGMLKKVSSVSS